MDVLKRGFIDVSQFRSKKLYNNLLLGIYRSGFSDYTYRAIAQSSCQYIPASVSRELLAGYRSKVMPFEARIVHLPNPFKRLTQ